VWLLGDDDVARDGGEGARGLTLVVEHRLRPGLEGLQRDLEGLGAQRVVAERRPVGVQVAVRFGDHLEAGVVATGLSADPGVLPLLRLALLRNLLTGEPASHVEDGLVPILGVVGELLASAPLVVVDLLDLGDVDVAVDVLVRLGLASGGEDLEHVRLAVDRLGHNEDETDTLDPADGALADLEGGGLLRGPVGRGLHRGGGCGLGLSGGLLLLGGFHLWTLLSPQPYG
jgi:hypothetical protein